MVVYRFISRSKILHSNRDVTVKAYGRGFWHLSRDGLYRATPVWFMRDHPKYRPNLVAFFDKQGVLRTFSNPINEHHYDAVRA